LKTFYLHIKKHKYLQFICHKMRYKNEQLETFK